MGTVSLRGEPGKPDSSAPIFKARLALPTWRKDLHHSCLAFSSSRHNGIPPTRIPSTDARKKTARLNEEDNLASDANRGLGAATCCQYPRLLGSGMST